MDFCNQITATVEERTRIDLFDETKSSRAISKNRPRNPLDSPSSFSDPQANGFHVIREISDTRKKFRFSCVDQTANLGYFLTRLFSMDPAHFPARHLQSNKPLSFYTDRTENTQPPSSVPQSRHRHPQSGLLRFFKFVCRVSVAHYRVQMVSHKRQSVRHLVPLDRMFPMRLPLLHILSRYRKCSSLLRRCRFETCKKQQKRLRLVPCSVKRLDRTNVGKEIVMEIEGKEDPRVAEIEKVEEEKTSPGENEVNIKELYQELPGIPVVPSNHSTKRPGVIFIFEKASLVPAYVGKNYQILNPDDHANFLRRKKKDPYSYRPEIVYLALLEVIGSKLYETGGVQAIYIRTDEGVLIKVEPHTRMPKTFGSFCALMSELLQKFSIKAKGKRGKLLHLIENPVTQHLPSNCYKIGLSFSSEKLVHLKSYVGAIKNDVNLVFVVGAMAHGKIDSDFTDEVISVSEYPLSAAQCVGLICRSLEGNWKIH